MARVAVFDVNETTLDLAPVRTAVNELLGGARGFQTWFARLLQMSMALSATGRYTDFSELAESALDSAAQSEAVDLVEGAWGQVASAMGSMSAHADVAGGLESLRRDGWQLIALTNSAQRSVDAQLAGAGIVDAFDHILSVDSVKAYKPLAAPYQFAAEVAGTDPKHMWMVACHDWDLAGAKAVGMSTAFITRPGMPFGSAYPPADLTVDSFKALAAALINS